MAASTLSSPAGRPRSFDDEEVLDRALELFWKRGYRATTTRELESSLGLKASSLYNAFGPKEALLDTALDRYERRITSGLLEPLERSSEGLDALEGFFAALGRWLSDEGRGGCMLINLMAEDGGASASIRKRTRGYRNRLRRAFREALERAARAGEIGETEIEARAELLLCLVLGLNIAARGGVRGAELKRLVSAVHAQVAGFRRGP